MCPPTSSIYASPAGQRAGPTFADIVHRCQAGSYDTVDALEADAAAAAGPVRGLAEEAERAEQARQAKRGRQAEQRLPEHWCVVAVRRLSCKPWEDQAVCGGCSNCACVAPRVVSAASCRAFLTAPPPLLPPAPSVTCRQDAQAAVTEACSLQDKVDAACFLLRQELSLCEPSNAQLLAAAAAHVRGLQQEEQQRRQAEAEAAQRAREAEAEQAAAEEQQGAEAQQEPAAEHQEQCEEQLQAAQDAAAAVQAPQGDGGEQHGLSERPSGQGGPPAEAQEAAQVVQGDTPADAAPAATASGEEPQLGEELQAANGAPAAADAAPAGCTLPSLPPADAAAGDDAAERRRQLQQLACRACLHLQQRLAAELLPAAQHRLGLAPVEEGSTAWQALQESSGWLSGAAAAACNTLIPAAVGGVQHGQQPSELVAALLAGDAVALEHCTTHLAVSCVVAFNVATRQTGTAREGSVAQP